MPLLYLHIQPSPVQEDISIKECIFVLAFDSDILTKPEVHQALSRFKRFLEGRRIQREFAEWQLTISASGRRTGHPSIVRAIDNGFHLGNTVLGKEQIHEFDQREG